MFIIWSEANESGLIINPFQLRIVAKFVFPAHTQTHREIVVRDHLTISHLVHKYRTSINMNCLYRIIDNNFGYTELGFLGLVIGIAWNTLFPLAGPWNDLLADRGDSFSFDFPSSGSLKACCWVGLLGTCPWQRPSLRSTLDSLCFSFVCWLRYSACSLASLVCKLLTSLSAIN